MSTTDPLIWLNDDADGDGAVWGSKKAPANARRADRIYTRLKKSILSGEIPARTRLVETDVAERLGTSRTPVREAISRLISDQLVMPLAYGGVEVVDTTAELENMYLVREALEGVAARLAAVNIRDAELERLQEIVDLSHTISLDDYDRRIALNTEFHNIVIGASRFERLIRLIEDYREIFLNFRMLSKYTKAESRLALRQHRDIMEALRSRDGKLAERAMRKHLEHGRKTAFKRPEI